MPWIRPLRIGPLRLIVTALLVMALFPSPGQCLAPPSITKNGGRSSAWKAKFARLMLAKKILAEYDLGKVIDIVPFKPGQVRHEYQKRLLIQVILSGGRRLALKEQHESPDQLHCLYSIQEYLAKRGYPTPFVHKTKSGKFYATIGATRYAVLDYVQGDQGDWIVPLTLRIGAAKLLALLHRDLRDMTVPSGLASGPDLYEEFQANEKRMNELAATIQRRGPPGNEVERFVLEYAAFLRDQFKAAGKNFPSSEYHGLPKNLIHGDYAPVNQIIAGDAIAAVVDFTPALEVRARDFIAGFEKPMPGQTTQEALALFTAVYQREATRLGFPLSDEEIRHVPEIYRLSRLRLLSRLANQGKLDQLARDVAAGRRQEFDWFGSVMAQLKRDFESPSGPLHWGDFSRRVQVTMAAYHADSAKLEGVGIAGIFPPSPTGPEASSRAQRIAQLKKIAEAADFVLYSEEGGNKLVYLDRDTGLIGKVGREPETFDTSILPTYALARETLGGLVARTAILDDVTVTIDGERKHLKHFKIQEKLTPLHRTLEYLLGVKKEKKAAEKLIDEFVDLQHRIWERGMVDSDFLFRNYGLNRRGELLSLDMGQLRDKHDDIGFIDFVQQNESNRKFLQDLDPAMASYYVERIQYEMSPFKLGIIWKTNLAARRSLEFPDPEEIVSRQTMTQELQEAQEEVAFARQRSVSDEVYRKKVREIIIERLHGHPVSHFVKFGLRVYPQEASPVHAFLLETLREYPLSRFDDKALNPKQIGELGAKVLSQRGNLSVEELNDLMFVFEAFLLIPSTGYRASSRLVWEDLKATDPLSVSI